MEFSDNSNPEQQIEYGMPLESLKTLDLKVGDFLEVITISGSRYVFKVTKIEERRVYVQGEFGSGKLADAEGMILNKVINRKERLFIGDSETYTSAINKILVWEESPPEEYNSQLYEYNQLLEEVNAKGLQIGDYIHAVDEKGTYYCFEVARWDIVTKKPKLRLVLMRNMAKPRTLYGEVVGKGLIMVTGRIRTEPLQKVKITRTPNEAFEEAEFGDPGNEELFGVNPNLLVSGVGIILSKIERRALAILELPERPDQIDPEELEAVWEEYQHGHLGTVNLYSGPNKAQIEIVFEAVRSGVESLLKRFGR